MSDKIKVLVVALIGTCLVLLLLSTLITGSIVLTRQNQPERDDTDPADGFSHMWLRTDNATGCQYLEGERGGITPRLDSGGRHKGCK